MPKPKDNDNVRPPMTKTTQLLGHGQHGPATTKLAYSPALLLVTSQTFTEAKESGDGSRAMVTLPPKSLTVDPTNCRAGRAEKAT
jgi:hypothetical protein